MAAAEEERFRRIKHWAGFPSEAIRYCLAEANLRLGNLEHIAINQDSKANLKRKLAYTLAKRPDLGLVLDRLRNKRERASIDRFLNKTIPGETFRGQIHAVEHHLAHLASSFHVSGFDEASVVSVDGFGDFASAAWGLGIDTEIEIENRVYFPHSLGVFYQAMTQYLGFPHYGDEYKVMGLAAYGEPRYLDKMRGIVQLQDKGTFKLNLEVFRHHRENVDYEWDNGAPVVGALFASALEDLLGPARTKDQNLEQHHRDIARSVQAMYEEAFFHLLHHLHKRHGKDAICVAGGCGMNSVANGKITRNTPFKQVYVQSAAGDAGGAIGAAIGTWHKLGGERRFKMDHAYWGPQFSNDDIARVLETRTQEIQDSDCEITMVDDYGDLCRETANAISDGLIVGWFQGRMEWGPRALGNRSILADPRRADIREVLNHKIKRRESFRPFAPSVLREAVSEWFETDDDVPFMMKVYPIRQEKRAEIPAVCHIDGTGRLQTVYRYTNPRYYQLIERYRKVTGIPMLLNTSFNENEPVVCKPEEALDCFLRTRMDILVMGSWLVRRES